MSDKKGKKGKGSKKSAAPPKGNGAADQKQTLKEAGKIVLIPLDLIDATALQCRSSVGDLTELTASIASKGIQSPISVQAKKSGRFALFVGCRRFEAAKLAGLSEVPAVVHSRDKNTRQGMFELNLTENIQREDINPIDEAKALKRLQEEFGLDGDEVCSRLGINKKRLDGRLGLLQMSDILQKALIKGRIPMRAAREIHRLPLKNQEKFIGMAEELKGDRLVRMIDKELDRIKVKAEGAQGGTDTSSKDQPDPEKAEIRSLITGMRQAGQVVCSGLGYDDETKKKVKAVNFRPMAVDDLRVVARLLDDCADQVPDDIDFNSEGEHEIIATVEGGYEVNGESPIVRQSLIQAIRQRAVEFARDEHEGSGGPIRVTYADVRAALDDFFVVPEDPDGHSTAPAGGE